jgi:hypothetical protein
MFHEGDPGLQQALSARDALGADWQEKVKKRRPHLSLIGAAALHYALRRVPTAAQNVFSPLARALNSVFALPSADQVMAEISDARPDVVVRVLATDYCEDCALSVPEPINPTATIAMRGINLELHMLGAIIPNVPTTWNKELLCSGGLSDFGITDDLGPRVIQSVVRERKQSERSDVESFVQRDETVVTVPVERLAPTRNRAFLDHKSMTEWFNKILFEWFELAIEARHCSDACRPATLTALENTMAGRQHVLTADQTACAAVSFIAWGQWKFDKQPDHRPERKRRCGGSQHTVVIPENRCP